MSHHQIVIVGGGNAGISTASKLLLKDKNLDIAIVEPSTKHYYQPAWTLVGGGVFDVQDTIREEASVMPKGVKWIQQRVDIFQPEKNEVTLDNGEVLDYDILIVAAGIKLNWELVKGLKENLGKNGVCSNYQAQTSPYTYECISNLNKGKAIFYSPDTPVKCGGAPQKIMYLAADNFRKRKVLKDIDVQFWSGGTKIFAIPKYEKTLLNVCKRSNIKLNFKERLVEIDGENKRAKFLGIGEDNKGQETWVDYDMIHVTPPQGPPDFIKNSPLANVGGWVDVDKYSLQHVQFKNVFALGDVAGIPASKTGAAVRKQAPVLVQNIFSFMKGEELKAAYNGYSSCPIVTGYGKLMLAEFDYENQPMETFPFDQSKERWSMYILKRYILPWLYWNQILPGRM